MVVCGAMINVVVRERLADGKDGTSEEQAKIEF
jgi:hypothetical protein